MRATLILATAVVALSLIGMPALAAPPPEVTGVGFDAGGSLFWGPTTDTDTYNVYRRASNDAGTPPRCHLWQLGQALAPGLADPRPGEWFGYVVTAESVEGESPAGAGEGGVERALLGRCTPVAERRLLNGLGYGRDDWATTRIEQLGLDGYVAEQLAPASIDESGNTELSSRLTEIDPPDNVIELIGTQIVRSTYSRKQLEQRLAMFWANHFNTYYVKIAGTFSGLYPPCDQGGGSAPSCDPAFPEISQRVAAQLQYRDIESYRAQSFGASFERLAEACALGPAMIIYLDTLGSTAAAPNENFPRELLELYMMGVNGGYTQTDVEEMARVFTGWSICNKLTTADGPLDDCVDDYWTVEPNWVAHFIPNLHDCGAKTLFAGTDQQRTLPSTCDNPRDGVNDVSRAISAIAEHPATADFISRKLIELLVNENVTDAQAGVAVAAWNDASNPAGRGDVQAVVDAILGLPEFADPTRPSDKYKTPFEAITSAFRILAGNTSGVALDPTLLLLHQHLPFYNPIPTGYSEKGSSWIDTNNLLQRQNLAVYAIAGVDPNFLIDPFPLLTAAGIDTSVGDNPEEVVDFLADRLFAGEWTTAERAAALQYMTTDYDGAETPYDPVRVLEMLAYLLGTAQFHEQ